jgi:hypothetical protein
MRKFRALTAFLRQEAVVKIPTVDDVFDLAHQIGVPLPEWLRAGTDWSSTLHELAHWAVKPDRYVQQYVEKIKPYAPAIPMTGIPDAEEVMCWRSRPTVRYPDGSIYQLPVNYIATYQLDPTPDEFGARAWGQQVLERLQWCHPMDCPDLKTPRREEFGNAQFDPNRLQGEEHPISCYGPDQLQFMGIDVANGIFRPQVEVEFDGQWLRVFREGAIIWQQDVLAGLEVIAWEMPKALSQFDKPILLEELIALAERQQP